MTRLAAVVVNHRTPERTRACVESLGKSRRSADHVIVVDNGPAGPLAVPGAEVLVLAQNLGFAGGANHGIRHALAGGAELVFLLNSDARVGADTLGRLEKALETDSGAGIAGPALVENDGVTVEALGIRYEALTGRVTLEGHGRPLAGGATRRVAALTGCALLVKRPVFEAIGLLPEEYFYGFEDLDFAARASRAGFASVLVPSAVVRHEGAATLGAGSPDRVYYGVRNHLLCASRVRPLPAPLSLLRAANVTALNAAHLALRSPAPLGSGLVALAQGVADHARKRYGRR